MPITPIELTRSERDLILLGLVIHAIKALRERAQLGLQAAKNIVYGSAEYALLRSDTAPLSVIVLYMRAAVRAARDNDDGDDADILWKQLTPDEQGAINELLAVAAAGRKEA